MKDMKNMKKVCSLFLSITLLVGLVACGSQEGKSDEKKVDSEQTQKTETSAVSEEKETSAVSEETGDGRSKAFAAFEDTVKVKVVMGYTESTLEGVTPSTCYWNDFLQDKFNIELDWMWEVPSDQYNTKLSIALASGDYPDILQCDYETYSYLLENDALADLTDVWEEYASDQLKASFETDGPSVLDRVMKDGKLMAVPYADDYWHYLNCVYYRTDWLENVGLDIPTNIAELTEVIKAFRDNDPDGNGEKDTYALALGGSNPFSSESGLMSFFNSFGSYPNSFYEKDGQIVHGMIQDETKEALDWLRELYAEGYIDPEFAVLSEEQRNTQVANNERGIIAGGWYTPDRGYMIDAMRNCETAMWSVQPVLGKEEGDIGYSGGTENNVSGYNVVLATASEEAKIAMIKMLNIFYDYNYYDGTSGVEWPHLNADPESEEYQDIVARHYSWWLPVTCWDMTYNYRYCEDLTKAYETGEYSYFLTQGNADSEAFFNLCISILKMDRSEVPADSMEIWYLAYSQALSRFNTDIYGKCSISTLHDEMVEGHYVADVFYGNETETGTAVASTLLDYATEYVYKYIMGNTSEDSWEEFVDGWLAMGGEDWTKEVNEAYYEMH